MAEVYLGRHVGSDGKFGPMVAVKRLLPHLVADSAIVQMFLNEARITAQISHPNVVRILDLGHENGEPYIAMELLEGRSFAELRFRAAQLAQRVPLGITLKVLADACRGLDAAHRAVDEQGRFLCIVHRDFTPDNIHVGVSGDIKVIDFGIAKAQNLGTGTEPGTLKGKFFYMSPEMIAGRPVDHRADIFAAGVMLYEQLCGRRPFTGTGPDQVLARIAEGQARRPTEFDPSVPPVLEAICLMTLSREPQKRFASLSEFIHAIESVGGVAQVATREEVGAYVSEMFPAEQDPKRQTLRRARAADPSTPSAKRRTDGAGASPATPTESGDPQAAAAAAAAPPHPSPARRRRRWPWALGAALISFAAGGGLVYWKFSPGSTPTKLLADAQTTSDPSARAKLLESLADDSRTTEAQFKKAGSLLIASGPYEAALKVAERFAARFPLEEAAFLLEAKASLKLRLGKRAQAAIDKAAGLSPMDTEPDVLLADLREAQGDLPGALEAIGRSLKKRPNSTALLARNGYLLSQAGRLDEASEVLVAVLQKKFDPESAAELGFVRLRQKETADAIVWLRRALKKEPRLAKGHYYLAAALNAQGDLKDAEREYREADAIAPGDPAPLSALCEMLARSGHAAEAKDVKQLLASRFPHDAAVARCAP
jgi:serine/threonine protein kinase/tetratricopeptide (TPR) repeat protein